MKRLGLTLVLLLMLYCGYWAAASRYIPAAAAEAIADMEQDGLRVTHSEINVKGFPLTFKSAPLGLSIDSLTAPRWSANASQTTISAKAYFPFTQTVDIAGPIEVNIPSMGWQFALSPQHLTVESSKRPFTQAAKTSLKAQGLNVTSPAGLFPISRLERAQYSDTSRRKDGQFQDYAANFKLQDIELRGEAIGDLGTALGLNIESLSGDITASFTLDPSGHSVPPVQRTLNSDRLALIWGPADIIASAQLSADNSGAVNGSITLAIKDRLDLTRALAQSGILSSQEILGINLVLATGAKGEDGRTIVTLNIHENDLSYNGVPLGRIPF